MASGTSNIEEDNASTMMARVHTLSLSLYLTKQKWSPKQKADIHTYCTYWLEFWLELAWDGGGGTLRRICKVSRQIFFSMNGCACSPLALILLFFCPAARFTFAPPLPASHEFCPPILFPPSSPSTFMAVALLIQTWRAADAEKCLYPRSGLYVHASKINSFFLPPRIGALRLMQQCCSHTSEGGCVLF